MEIVFASNNTHKLHEIAAILGPAFKLKSLTDIGCHEDIPEPWPSLEENALAKARFVYERFGFNCFADDTGLEVEALDGKPGVLSARYAGPGKDSRDNMLKLLDELKGTDNRRARFRTVIALIMDGKEHLFEGIVEGHIIYAPQGTGGFGYDPVFVPVGYDQTFGELPADLKNTISHRYRAIDKLVRFLKEK
ncbi:MAG: non-canonical purine NTP diphosphatase [Bacteroidales bacterium]|nr:non-canonical purine NTP diphosphatase [Bacteroidales bacterium]